MGRTINQQTPPRRWQYKEWHGKGGVQGVTSHRQERLRTTREREGQDPKEGEERRLHVSSSCHRPSPQSQNQTKGTKRTKMVSRDELLAMLREKERTIKKLQAEVHS
jgi:hypothetical protein